MCSLDTFFPVNRLFRQKSFNNNINKGNVFVFFHELLTTDFVRTDKCVHAPHNLVLLSKL